MKPQRWDILEFSVPHPLDRVRFQGLLSSALGVDVDSVVFYAEDETPDEYRAIVFESDCADEGGAPETCYLVSFEMLDVYPADNIMRAVARQFNVLVTGGSGDEPHEDYITVYWPNGRRRIILPESLSSDITFPSDFHITTFKDKFGISGEPKLDHLLDCAAKAFGILPEEVSVRPSEYVYKGITPRTERTRLFLSRTETRDVEGDFPAFFRLFTGDQDLLDQLGGALQRLAIFLGLVVMWHDQGEGAPLLLLPDGTSVRRPMPQLEYGGFLLPVDLRTHEAGMFRPGGDADSEQESGTGSGPDLPGLVRSPWYPADWYRARVSPARIRRSGAESDAQTTW